MKNILIFILVSAIPSLISCFNPFFPQTGTPPQVESSPERTIHLLKEAYVHKDIYSFEGLIYSKNEFSSYIQVSDVYSLELNKLLFEPKVYIDSIFAFAPNGFLPRDRYYFELKWEQERKIHEKMFHESSEIVFLSSLYAADNPYYEVIGNDTISALVKTHPSQMRVTYGGNDFTVDITGQIFAMKKDNGIWKIWKWIELN